MIINRLFLVSSGQPCFTKIQFTGQQIDNRLETFKRSVTSCLCLGCLDEAVESFEDTVVYFTYIPAD